MCCSNYLKLLVNPIRMNWVSGPGRLRDPSWGYYGPCARCSLTARRDRRDTQARTGAELLPQGDSESRSRASRGAPVGDPAGDLRAFSEIDLSARTVMGAALPHRRLSALCSPHF